MASKFLWRVSRLVYTMQVMKRLFNALYVYSWQEVDTGTWHFNSMSGSNPDGYSVVLQTATCQDCSSYERSRTWTAPKCTFLCVHMYRCDSKCYDFKKGHICKHIHRVHSLNRSSSSNSTSLELAKKAEENESEKDAYSSSDDFTEIAAYAGSISDSKQGCYHIFTACVNYYKYISLHMCYLQLIQTIQYSSIHLML